MNKVFLIFLLIISIWACNPQISFEQTKGKYKETTVVPSISREVLDDIIKSIP